MEMRDGGFAEVRRNAYLLGLDLGRHLFVPLNGGDGTSNHFD